MCATATDVYADCLDEWGVAWEAAGYTDARDFTVSCDTWAWTSRELEAEADQDGATDQLCRQRHDALPALTCDAFAELDWSSSPWTARPAPDSAGAP